MNISKYDINEILVLKIMKFYCKNSNMNDESIKNLYLGLYTIISTATKMIIIVFTSIILGLWKETLILISMMFLIRFFSGGIHMKNSFSCTIASLLFYIGGAFISSYHLVHNEICIILCLLFLLVIIAYSPCETEKRPIKDENKRKKLKLLTAVALAVLFFINIFIYNNLLFNITLVAFFSQMIFVSPILFKIIK